MEEEERGPKGHQICTMVTVIDGFILPLEEVAKRQYCNIIGDQVGEPEKKDEELLGSAFPKGSQENEEKLQAEACEHKNSNFLRIPQPLPALLYNLHSGG